MLLKLVMETENGVKHSERWGNGVSLECKVLGRSSHDYLIWHSLYLLSSGMWIAETEVFDPWWLASIASLVAHTIQTISLHCYTVAKNGASFPGAPV